MGPDLGLEAGADGGGVRAIHSGRDLSYLCCGWSPDGHLVRDLFQPVSRVWPASSDLRCGFDPAALVLRGADGMAGLGHSGDRHVNSGDSGLGHTPPDRAAQLPSCGSAYYIGLAAATTLPGRFSTLLFGRALHHSDFDAAAEPR